jgi:hypothetical protein
LRARLDAWSVGPRHVHPRQAMRCFRCWLWVVLLVVIDTRASSRVSATRVRLRHPLHSADWRCSLPDALRHRWRIR